MPYSDGLFDQANKTDAHKHATLDDALGCGVCNSFAVRSSPFLAKNTAVIMNLGPGAIIEASAKVDHPAHYGGDTVYEVIKVIEAWGLGFGLGNAVKYIARAGKKGELLEDLKKAQFYLNREIDKLGQKR